MEVIEVGSRPVEEVIDKLLFENNFQKLTGDYKTACFVLAHQMQNRNFYAQLIENAETIDATTRRHIAFVVFYGNRSSIVKECNSGHTKYKKKTRLTGFSTSTDTEINFEEEVVETEKNIRFSEALGEQLRYEDNSINQKALSHYMTRASTALMQRFGINESSLPCLLFVNPNNSSQFRVVNIDPEDPVNSLYHQILKPLSSYFYRFSQYAPRHNAIKQRIENLTEVSDIMTTAPKEV
ncbi:MAG: hypothetical protein C0490_09260, partial [Marivirga sp.]|nr:hypothetical protein [Marivirga sp.]